MFFNKQYIMQNIISAESQLSNQSIKKEEITSVDIQEEIPLIEEVIEDSSISLVSNIPPSLDAEGLLHRTPSITS